MSAKRKSLIALGIVCLLGLLPGCGARYEDLSVHSYYSEDSFRLPISERGLFEMPDVLSFESKMTLNELKDVIDETDFGTASVETYLSPYALMIEKTAASEVNYYTVLQGTEKMFYTGAVANIDGVDAIFPYHLVEASRPWEIFPDIESRTEFPTSHGLEEYVSFYEKTGRFSVEINEKQATVSIKRESVSPERLKYFRPITISLDGGHVSFSAADPS